MPTEAPPKFPLQLPGDLAECHEMIQQLGETVEQLSARVDYLVRRLFGTKSERIDPHQIPLFAEAEQPLPETPPDSEPEEQSRPKRKGHGRKPLPKDLPRKRVVHDVAPEEKVCPGCGCEKCRIGEEVSEQLDYVPASLYVIEHVCPKYACKHCQEHVVQGKKPAQAIEKSLAGPGLIAHVITSKYADHLPLHRQEDILARHGVELSRKTLCGWILQSGDALGRLVQAMKEHVLQSRVIHTDDTAVPVQVPGKKRKTHKGYLWVYVGDPDHPYTLYDFTWTRGREGPERYLLYEDQARCYRGYLQADAYAGYDRLYVNRDIVEAGCMAHARRKYYDARTSAAVPAHEALRRIKEVYAIEARAKEAGDDAAALRARRQEEAKPLLDDFHEWVLAAYRNALPKSPFSLACGYTADLSYLRNAFGPICDVLKPRRRRNRTPQDIADMQRHDPVMRAAYLEHVTTAQVSDFIRDHVQRYGLQAKTANRYREVLRRLFSWSMEEGGVRMPRDINPAAKVKRYKERAPEIRFLTLRQIDQQLEVLWEHPVIHAMVATYIYAGLRRDEAIWLTTDDVELAIGEPVVIRVQAKTVDNEFWESKTKINRTVPISRALRAILDSYERPGVPTPWFFPSPRGRRWDPDNLSQALRTINRAAGLPWSSLDYRHTFGSQLAMKGESLYKISALMGNSPEICRRHYATLMPEALVQSVEFGNGFTENGSQT